MKTKITSLTLVISLIISIFAIYPLASGINEISSDDITKVAEYVHYKNSFGDDTDDIGGTLKLNNAELSGVYTNVESNGNKYGHYTFTDKDKNVYFQITADEKYSPSPDKQGYLILEMDFNDFGNALNTDNFLDINSGTGSFAPVGGRVGASDIINVANDSNGNYFYFCDSNSKIYIPSNTWVHIRCEMVVSEDSDTKYSFKCYIGEKFFESSFDLGTPACVTQIRIGSSRCTNQVFGLDNIILYSSPKYVSSYHDFSKVQALAMKVGAENASLNGTKLELTNVPMLLNGETYCPVDVLEEITSLECPSSQVAWINGAEYILTSNVKSVFGLEARTYDMGLILVGSESHLLSENASYDDIVKVMKTFVFDIPTQASIISDVSAYTNDFDHPYILANADKFSQLRSIYNSGKLGMLTNSEDLLLYEYINSYVKTAQSHFTSYCGIQETESYNGLKKDKIPVNTNYSKYANNGYDNGGRLTVNTTPLLYFAFAYQMTENLNYARAAYDYMLALGEWNHWGPAHFLNCADTAAPFAIAYDWLYNAFEALSNRGEYSKFDGTKYKNIKVDRKVLADILFTHVIIPGYVQSNNLNCPWPGSVESRYSTKTSNWNAVCASGVIISALVLLEESDISTTEMTFDTQKKLSSTRFENTVTPIESIGNASIHFGMNTIADYASKLAAMNLDTLAKYGLEQYAPDGSYVESPGYWSYGTNSLFKLIASLLSATGDDYGFMDAWGIDTTCYFAIHSESSDYKTWNFNDGSVGAQDSSFFFFVGDYYDDDNLVRVRKKQLSGGKSYSIYDILFYNTDITGEPELDTEYYMVGIDAYSVRSSWDKGSIYAGLIGGANTVSHGHMDAGSFIYHNNGKIWFHDLGADNYNMSEGYFSNFKLYRVGAEGHNMLTVTSHQSTLPYGQSRTADPKIVKTYSSDHGGYAILDMSDSYGSAVTSGYRGMLFTNSRSTVVIQDEYKFSSTTTAYWFGHYQIASGYVDDVVITADGKTAFMISGDDILRVTIVSDNSNLKFEIMDCYTYVLDITKRTNISTMGGSGTETSRDSFRKLAIKCENVNELNLAVVIEEVSGYYIGSSYEFAKMSEWQVSYAEKSDIEVKFEADFERDSSNTGSIVLETGKDAYVLGRYEVDSQNYLAILPKRSELYGKESIFKLHFANNLPINVSKNNYVCFDFDTFTEGTFINGSVFGIDLTCTDGTSEFASLIQFASSALMAGGASINLSDSWKHITVILDIENRCAYIYADNAFVSVINKIIPTDIEAIVSISIKLPHSGSCDSGSAILLDNFSTRLLSDTYKSEQLYDILSNHASLAGWSDGIKFDDILIPLAKAGNKYLYTNKQVEDAIKSASDITLLRDVTGIINVAKNVKVNTCGFNFDYTSSEYFPSVNGNLISFESGQVTVTWHIGDQIITDSIPYYGASVATFKGTSVKVGKISYSTKEYANGGVGYDFYTTAWASSPNGKPLSESEMVVTPDNCEFWLVDTNAVDCLFVTIDDSGNVTPYYSDANLRDILTNNNNIKKIVLCNDIELTGKTISLATEGKTIYLNGYSITHSVYDVHTFTYSIKAKDNCAFIGPGTLKSNGTRTMFTSTSDTKDLTSKFGIVAHNVNFVTNTQFADLRVGHHQFINCTITQTNANRSLFALWNKNPEFNLDGTPKNLLKLTFDNCTIKTDTSSTYAIFSYSTYSEVYLKDTAIVSSASLVSDSQATSKLYVSGSSVIVVSKLTTDTAIHNNVHFGNGVSTNLELQSTYFDAECMLVNSYDALAPYRVASEYATLVWQDINGNPLLSECVAVGITPKIVSMIICDYLNSLDEKYTYDLKEISAAESFILKPVYKEKVTLHQSISIDNDLILNIFINKSDMDDKVKSVKVNGLYIMQSSFVAFNVDGIEYYKYSISEFNPSNACRKLIITIEQNDGTVISFSTSVVDYLESLLSISTDETEKILAVKLLRYIQNAYTYFNSNAAVEVERITHIIDKYKAYDLVFATLTYDSVATGQIKDIVRSARFDISTTVKIRFYLNTNYTGHLVVNFNGVSNTYYVKNGIYADRNYLEITMPAYAINNNVTIGNENYQISFGLSSYATAMNNVDKGLHHLLEALSEYSAAAQLYKNEKAK